MILFAVCQGAQSWFVQGSCEDIYPKQMTDIQDDRKVTQPIPDTCSICQKSKLHLNRKTKAQCYIKCCKCPPRSAMHAFTLFLMFDATWWRVPVSRKRFTRRDIVGLFGTVESGNVSLNSFWQVK
jgi:hypothetical protein